MNVMEDENNVRITMFNRVVALYVGCHVDEYILPINVVTLFVEYM